MKATVATFLSLMMIIAGVIGITIRAAGDLQGVSWWLYKLLGIGSISLLYGGLHLFGVALKQEILEEVRKKEL